MLSFFENFMCLSVLQILQISWTEYTKTPCSYAVQCYVMIMFLLYSKDSSLNMVLILLSKITHMVKMYHYHILCHLLVKAFNKLKIKKLTFWKIH